MERANVQQLFLPEYATVKALVYSFDELLTDETDKPSCFQTAGPFLSIFLSGYSTDRVTNCRLKFKISTFDKTKIFRLQICSPLKAEKCFPDVENSLLPCYVTVWLVMVRCVWVKVWKYHLFC